MQAGLFYFSANIAGLTAVVLAGAACLASNPRSLDARLFAGVALSSACYILGRLSYAVPGPVQVHFWFFPILLLIMNLGPGLWMILAYSLFQDERRIPRWMIGAFALQAGLSAINAIGYLGRGSSVLQSPDYPSGVNFLFGPLPLAMQSMFAVLALYWTVHGWRADLVAGRRFLRGLFLVVVGGLASGISAAELAMMGAPHAARLPVDNAITLALAAGYAAVALAVLRFDARVLDRLASRISPVPDPATDPTSERDLAALTRALEVEKIYLTPGLTVGGLARRLTIPEYRLRALIHKRLGFRNFNALLHEYRLREACDRLVDPAQEHLPILTIALDVGYQSITPFNQSFRQAMGCTPSAFRQRRRQDTEPA